MELVGDAAQQPLRRPSSLGALPLEPGTSSLGLAHWVQSHPCPQKTWRIGKWLVCPSPGLAQHPLGESRDSVQNCLSSHKSPQNVKTSEPTASPLFAGKETEALRQYGKDLAIVTLWLCPWRKH